MIIVFDWQQLKIYDPILNQHKQMDLSKEEFRQKSEFKSEYEKKE